MDSSARATGYDLFKLIVAIILLLIFICLLVWTPANAPQAGTPTPADTPISPTQTRLVATTIAPPIPSPAETSTSNASTVTAPPLPSPTETPASSRLTSTALPIPPPIGTSTSNELTATFPPIPSPTGTSAPGALTATALPIASPITTSSLQTVTPVLIPSPTRTSTSVPPTSIPSPTQSPVPAPSSTPIVEVPSDTEVCDAATSRSRLQVGRNAIILRRLNFRTSPGIRNNWILTNIPGTQVEIIDGPVCLPHFIGAYLWWQIKLPDGRLGWSAEASLFGKFYFIEPVK